MPELIGYKLLDGIIALEERIEEADKMLEGIVTREGN